MINGLGVVGWGVGGIEAEAGMLGQPVYFLTPEVVGVHLTGTLKEGVTATDLVLRVTEMLRKQKVVGKFVEFFGEGAAALSVTDRATIGNMAPEYGATMGFFGVDEETRRLSARHRAAATNSATPSRTIIRLRVFGEFRARARWTTLWNSSWIWHRSCRVWPVQSGLRTVSIFRSSSRPSRPFSRNRSLKAVMERNPATCRSEFRCTSTVLVPAPRLEMPSTDTSSNHPEEGLPRNESELITNRPTPDRPEFPSSAYNQADTEIGHGSVLIAAITSCTNTSNPSVMLGAALLAKKAVERGLKVNPAVKTSLGPGSRVVTDYLEKTGLQPYFDKLGFQTVGYGCTTCIGNSGPLHPALEEAIAKNDLVAASVLSGNRNFEARVHQNIRANFLMSPPLVVAFALAGTRGHRPELRSRLEGTRMATDVYLKEIWPTLEEIRSAMASALKPEVYRKLYSDFAEQNPKWNEIPSSTGEVYQWDRKEHLHPRAAILRGIRDGAGPYQRDQRRAPAWYLRRFRHNRSHQPRWRDQEDQPGRKVSPRDMVCQSRISTATAHAEATTAS